MKPASGKAAGSVITRSWRYSYLCRLMEGSFFLGWLISDNRVLAAKRDLAATSVCCRAADRMLRAVMRPLYRMGRRLAPVLEGSILFSRPLAVLGALLILGALAAAAKSRGFFGCTTSAALFSAGIGLIRPQDARLLAEGSVLIRFISWWNNTD